MPDDVIDNLKLALKGGKTIENIEGAIEIERSLPHGHISAVLGTLKKIGLDKILGKEQPYLISLVISLIVSRIVNPCSGDDLTILFKQFVKMGNGDFFSKP